MEHNHYSFVMYNRDDFLSQNTSLIDRSKRELTDGCDKDPMDKLRLQCYSQGATGILDLARTLRNMEVGGKATLTFEEFVDGVRNSGLDCTDDELKVVFERFDADSDGAINTTEFLRELRPAMSESRLTTIEKAFSKMDTAFDGIITLNDLKRFYCVDDQSKYISGEMSKNEILAPILEIFKGGRGVNYGKVTKEDFINYYATVSESYDNDSAFDLLLRHAYKF